MTTSRHSTGAYASKHSHPQLCASHRDMTLNSNAELSWCRQLFPTHTLLQQGRQPDISYYSNRLRQILPDIYGPVCELQC